MDAEAVILALWGLIVLVALTVWLAKPRRRRSRMTLWDWLGALLAAFWSEPTAGPERPLSGRPRSRRRQR